MAVVEHVTCVCLDVCTGLWIWSFATASCLSGRFHFLLSLLLPRGLPVSVRAEKRFLVLFLRQSGLHSGQNLGVKTIFARAVVHLKINQRQWKSKKKKINQSSRTAALWPKPAKVTALDAAHDAFLKCYFVFSQQTQTVTENDFFLFVCLFVLLCLCGASRRPCDLAHADVPADSTSPPGGLRSAHVPAGFRNQHHHVSESRHYGYLSALWV